MSVRRGCFAVNLTVPSETLVCTLMPCRRSARLAVYLMWTMPRHSGTSAPFLGWTTYVRVHLNTGLESQLSRETGPSMKLKTALAEVRAALPCGVLSCCSPEAPGGMGHRSCLELITFLNEGTPAHFRIEKMVLASVPGFFLSATSCTNVGYWTWMPRACVLDLQERLRDRCDTGRTGNSSS